MSIEDTKAKIEVMQAAIDGKAIEYRVGCCDEWTPLGKDSYLWNWAKCYYRVAPPKPRELWVVYSKSGERVMSYADYALATLRAGEIAGTCVKFVEVL